MRIMGLDIGEVRIGVAVSDATQTIAQSFGYIKTSNFEKDLAALKKIIEDNEVSLIIVGLPYNMDGSAGKQVDFVIDIAKKIEKSTGIKVKTYDERLTSKLAESILIKSDISRKKRKGKIDSLAATLILQGYLDSKKGN
jgi:putative Holliday junction resolvase